MSTVILDGTLNENNIDDTLKSYLTEKNQEISYFKLSNMNILPCKSCGTCGFDAPGQCVLKDQMAAVLKAISGSNIIVFVTPVRFGGYSSHLKKAVDRLMVLGLPLYFVKNGNLLHPPRYPGKTLLVIGIMSEDTTTGEDDFKNLVARNSLNMHYPHKTLIVRPNDNIKIVEHKISELLSEVV